MTFFRHHLLILQALILGCAILLVGFAAKIFIPVQIQSSGSVILLIEKGQSLTSISRELEKYGVIDSPFLFRLIMTISSSEYKVPAGLYLFADQKNPSRTPRFSIYKVARMLSTGDYGFRPAKIVIPEGLNSLAISIKVHNQLPAIDALQFAEEAKKYEGYLFPDTYFISPFATSGEVITQMRDNFNVRVLKDANLMASIKNSGHSLADIIKMASILEGEVRTTEDRKLVADLLWRRIKNGMPLQVDSAFQYINQKTSAELTQNDLKIDSPYNTYKYRGLPPTPISNPGIDTIMAAATPTANLYLYFLNDDEGTTYFSKTYAEHLKLKNKYLK